MKISDRAAYDATNYAIQSNRDRYTQLQIQIASGKRYQLRSEEQQDSAEAARVSAVMRENEQWQDNVDSALSWTKITEGRVSETIEVVQNAQELAIQGSNGLYAVEDRQNIAEEINALLEEMVSLANTRYGDSYLLSGQNSDVPPVTTTLDANGDITAVTAAVVPNWDKRKIQVNDQTFMEYGATAVGPEGIFINTTTGTDLFQNLIDLRDQLSSGAIPDDTILQGLQSSIDDISNSIVSVGVSQSRLQNLSDYQDQVVAAEYEHLSSLEDTDMALALTDLSLMEASLTAALQMAAQMDKMTILNYV